MTEPGELNIDDLLAEAENPAYRLTKTARILMGKAVGLLEEHAELDRRLAEAVLSDTTASSSLDHEAKAPGLAREVAALEQQIEDSKTPFRFVAIGRKAWADLVALHPPTKDDLKSDQRANINGQTFPPAAIAASCTSPTMTVEQVQRLEAALPDSQWMVLWDSCLAANLGGLTNPKSAIAGSILRESERSATTAANEGFHDPGSLDG